MIDLRLEGVFCFGSTKWFFWLLQLVHCLWNLIWRFEGIEAHLWSLLFPFSRMYFFSSYWLWFILRFGIWFWLVKGWQLVLDFALNRNIKKVFFIFLLFLLGLSFPAGINHGGLLILLFFINLVEKIDIGIFMLFMHFWWNFKVAKGIICHSLFWLFNFWGVRLKIEPRPRNLALTFIFLWNFGYSCGLFSIRLYFELLTFLAFSIIVFIRHIFLFIAIFFSFFFFLLIFWWRFGIFIWIMLGAP